MRATILACAIAACAPRPSPKVGAVPVILAPAPVPPRASLFTLPTVALASTTNATPDGFVEINRDATIVRGGDRDGDGPPLADSLDASTLLPAKPALEPARDLDGALSSRDAYDDAGAPAHVPRHAEGVVERWGAAGIPSGVLIIADRDTAAARVLDQLVEVRRAALAVATPRGVRALLAAFVSADLAPKRTYVVVALTADTAHVTAVTNNAFAPKLFHRDARDPAAIVAAWRAARQVRGLGAAPRLWIQLDDSVSYARFVAIVAAIVAAGTTTFDVGRDPPIVAADAT